MDLVVYIPDMMELSFLIYSSDPQKNFPLLCCTIPDDWLHFMTCFSLVSALRKCVFEAVFIFNDSKH